MKTKELIIEEIDLYLTQWLKDFANKPLKERKNAFEEVYQIRRILLNRFKK